MNTPLASKTTVSSRNKMAAGLNNHTNNNNPTTANPARTIATTTTTSTTLTATSKLPPRTAFKPPLPSSQRTTVNLAATSSRIALSRSRLSGNSTATTTPAPASRPGLTSTGTRNRQIVEPRTVAANHRLPSNTTSSVLAARRLAGNSTTTSRGPSFTDSRSSSKLSSVSSVNHNNNISNNTNHYNNVDQQTLQQSSAARKNSSIPASNYIPDTNTIRKGLAKFSNPIECQRQFQTLTSKLRELTDINENKEKTIVRLQDQLSEALDKGVGYAIVVQYFSKKLKLDSELSLEAECEQMESELNKLRINERQFEQKLDSIVEDYKEHLKLEQDLKAGVLNELEETKVNHSNELVRLTEEHQKQVNDLEVRHSGTKEELENRIQVLETDLNTRTRELQELKKEYDSLNESFNKLEESLTKDKDARVKYAQEKANQLQKDVDSLNSVLEMRTERIHALEKDSILLGEVQNELMKTEDNNKALRQQLESLTAALENKRVQYENLLAEHEKIAQELKRERKERRRMTMRTEQLEYVLNESCATDGNMTVLDTSVES